MSSLSKSFIRSLVRSVALGGCLVLGSCVVGDDEAIEEPIEDGDTPYSCVYRLCAWDCGHHAVIQQDAYYEPYCCQQDDPTCLWYLQQGLGCIDIQRQDGHTGGNDCAPPGSGGGVGSSPVPGMSCNAGQVCGSNSDCGTGNCDAAGYCWCS